MDVELSDTLEDGWQFWRDWLKLVAPDNTMEIRALEADAGRYFGYVRTVCRRRRGVELMEPITSVPTQYVKQSLLRGKEGASR